MVAELDPIAETKLVASSGDFAQLCYDVVNTFFHSKPFVRLEILLAAERFTNQESAYSFQFNQRREQTWSLPGVRLKVSAYRLIEL